MIGFRSAFQEVVSDMTRKSGILVRIGMSSCFLGP